MEIRDTSNVLNSPQNDFLMKFSTQDGGKMTTKCQGRVTIFDCEHGKALQSAL